MSCLCHVFCASCAVVVCCRQPIRFLSLWLRTKPKRLVIVQSVIFLQDGLFDFFFSLQTGLFLLFFRAFFFVFFFRLKEMPCTCQVYCMKVITEPWRKYLNDALVMCCSDNFSFQSKINYCFIKTMSSCLFFIPSPSFFLTRKTLNLPSIAFEF